MPNDEQNLAEQYIAAFNSHDWNKIGPFFADDCIHEDMASGMSFHGKQDLKAYMDGIFTRAPNVKLKLESAFLSGDWMAYEWTYSGRYTGDEPGRKATGREFSIRGASVSELRDGKIRRNRDYYDMTTFLRQLGLMPNTPAV